MEWSFWARAGPREQGFLRVGQVVTVLVREDDHFGRRGHDDLVPEHRNAERGVDIATPGSRRFAWSATPSPSASSRIRMRSPAGRLVVLAVLPVVHDVDDPDTAVAVDVEVRRARQEGLGGVEGRFDARRRPAQGRSGGQITLAVPRPRLTARRLRFAGLRSRAAGAGLNASLKRRPRPSRPARARGLASASHCGSAPPAAAPEWIWKARRPSSSPPLRRRSLPTAAR